MPTPPSKVDPRLYFTPKAVQLVLDERAAVDSPTYDEFFRDQADTWPMPQIGIGKLLELARAQPLVVDGTESVAIGRGEQALGIVRPEPFRLNSFMSADELNDMRLLPIPQDRQTVADGHVRTIRNDLRVSIDGLCAQAISEGKFAWPIKVDGGGFRLFGIDFTQLVSENDQILVVRPDVDLTQTNGVKATDWVDYVDKVEDAFEARALAAPMKYRLGRNAWKGLMAVASNTKRTDSVKVEQGVEQIMVATPEGQPQRYRHESYIDVGGHRFVRYARTYHDLSINEAGNLVRSFKRVVPDDNVHAVSEGVRMQFRWLSISDLDIEFAALPLALKTIDSKDPSGVKVLGQSRPVPIPIVRAIMNSPAKPEA